MTNNALRDYVITTRSMVCWLGSGRTDNQQINTVAEVLSPKLSPSYLLHLITTHELNNSHLISSQVVVLVVYH